jgi:hypothetical protein
LPQRLHGEGVPRPAEVRRSCRLFGLEARRGLDQNGGHESHRLIRSSLVPKGRRVELIRVREEYKNEKASKWKKRQDGRWREQRNGDGGHWAWRKGGRTYSLGIGVLIRDGSQFNIFLKAMILNPVNNIT